MSMRLLSAALVVFVVPGVALAQAKKTVEEHPYAKAKVGDWVTYTVTTNAMGTKSEMTTTIRIAAKDDKSVTIKTSGRTSFMGMTTELPETESKIDLTQPYNATPTPPSKDVKVEKVGEGKEKVKVGDKEYDTTWTKNKVTTKLMGKDIVTESTVWAAKDVPLGMVKMETKFEGGSSTMELTASGTGKK